ncbi:MAG: OST-HTH/LOTUS domain-containing protein [Pirellulaceae bacterium]
MPKDRWLQARRDYVARRASFGSYLKEPTPSEEASEILADQEEELAEQLRYAHRLVLMIVRGLLDEHKEAWASQLPTELVRVAPAFRLKNTGFKTYLSLLQSVESRRLLQLTYDERHGDWRITCTAPRGSMSNTKNRPSALKVTQPSPRWTATSSHSQIADAAAMMRAALRPFGDTFVDLSQAKQLILESYPDFCEANYGFSRLKPMLEHMQSQNFVELRLESATRAWQVRIMGLPKNQATQFRKMPAFISSQKSPVFHRSACELGGKIAPNNRVEYATRKQAIGAGKHPCKECRP